MSDHDDQNPLSALMGQLQGMQAKARDLEARSANITTTGQAGGGVVKVVANGRMELVSVRIDKGAMDPNDPEMLEDLVVSAVNQAMRAAREAVAHEMAGLAGGLGLPFMGS